MPTSKTPPPPHAGSASEPMQVDPVDANGGTVEDQTSVPASRTPPPPSPRSEPMQVDPRNENTHHGAASETPTPPASQAAPAQTSIPVPEPREDTRETTTQTDVAKRVSNALSQEGQQTEVTPRSGIERTFPPVHFADPDYNDEEAMEVDNPQHSPGATLQRQPPRRRRVARLPRGDEIDLSRDDENLLDEIYHQLDNSDVGDHVLDGSGGHGDDTSSLSSTPSSESESDSAPHTKRTTTVSDAPVPTKRKASTLDGPQEAGQLLKFAAEKKRARAAARALEDLQGDSDGKASGSGQVGLEPDLPNASSSKGGPRSKVGKKQPKAQTAQRRPVQNQAAEMGLEVTPVRAPTGGLDHLPPSLRGASARGTRSHVKRT